MTEEEQHFNMHQNDFWVSVGEKKKKNSAKNKKKEAPVAAAELTF